MPLFRENVKTREEGGLRWDYHSFKAREICTQVGGVARDVERKGREKFKGDTVVNSARITGISKQGRTTSSLWFWKKVTSDLDT